MGGFYGNSVLSKRERKLIGCRNKLYKLKLHKNEVEG